MSKKCGILFYYKLVNLFWYICLCYHKGFSWTWWKKKWWQLVLTKITNTFNHLNPNFINNVNIKTKLFHESLRVFWKEIKCHWHHFQDNNNQMQIIKLWQVVILKWTVHKRTKDKLKPKGCNYNMNNEASWVITHCYNVHYVCVNIVF